MSRWPEWRYGHVWPAAVIEITKYIHQVVREASVTTFPKALGGALSWGLDQAMVRKALENAEVTLTTEGTVIKKALRFPVSVVAALELAVTAEDRLPVGPRVLAWARLSNIYGALRMDDLQRLHPKNVTMEEAGFFSGADPNKNALGQGRKFVSCSCVCQHPWVSLFRIGCANHLSCAVI